MPSHNKWLRSAAGKAMNSLLKKNRWMVCSLFLSAIIMVHCSRAAAETLFSFDLKCPSPRIVVLCSLKTLQLWCGSELVREYPVETGKGGLGKTREGDHKTPLGNYMISWMASRASGKGHRIMAGRSWCKNNRFVYATAGPPLEKLWTDAYGGESAAVMSLNYPNERDRSEGRTGQCIHIHGDKGADRGKLSKSYGCIHMFPGDAMELYEIVRVGTPVRIAP